MEPIVWYVEDDSDIAEYVREFLGDKGYRTEIFNDGISVRNSLRSVIPNVLLLDWNIPGDTAPSICKWIRLRNAELPIIVITVRDDPKDIVSGLQSGADDYMTKPFAIEVLVSRIEALLRRTSPHSPIMSCGGLTLDEDAHKAFIQGKPLELTPLEYRLLALFMRSKGRIVSRQIIQKSVWELDGSAISDNALTVAIKRLRAKLGAENHLTTVRGFGYRLEEPR